MGWSTWYAHWEHFHEETIVATAQAMAASGLRDRGYHYINLDDGPLVSRDANGRLQWDPNRFPNGIPLLAQYLHSQGFKLGMYLNYGHLTCQFLPGSYGYEAIDIQTLNAWGVDLVKIDNCSSEGLDDATQYQKFGEIMRTHAPNMVFSICSQGKSRPWEWGPLTGNMWRTALDIDWKYPERDKWRYVCRSIDANAPHHGVAGPGTWNDPDNLVVGRETLTREQERSQMSLWAIMAAPLIMGHDVTKQDEETLAILSNERVIAINQDALGIQGERIIHEAGREVWRKPLAGGSFAVAIFNRTDAPVPVQVSWADLGISGQIVAVEDAWQPHVTGASREGYAGTLDAFATRLLIVYPA